MVRYSAAALVLLLTPGLFAQESVKKIEDGVLDRIELYVPSLDHVNELTAVIKPFDAASAELGTGGKNGKDARQDEAKTMQQEGPRVLADRFVSALSHDGPFKDVRIADGDDTGNADLIIEGKFVTLDPGSRAKRYFVGFGAGKSAVKVTGTVKDASGRVLAVFTQRRVGAMGMGGGDSLGKLMTDARKIGEDIANFLSKWARGDDLDG